MLHHPHHLIPASTMALLLETTFGDLVIDLDVEGSPALCRNILKLAKARYYTSSLIYNVQPHRFCQAGDPRGDGTGGGCIYGLLDSEDITKSKARFLKSSGRVLSTLECREKGRVVATEMNGILDTIGSQFLITLEDGQERALDGYIPPHHNRDNDVKPKFLSLGKVTEDDNHVLDKIQNAYCDANGRPYADIRIERALVIHDPFPDPPELQELLKKRGVVMDEEGNVTDSPSYERPPEEIVELRISASQVDEEEDEQDAEKARQREEQIQQNEDKSRAVVLEMLGDLPSADIKAPENVLFVCKLNPITEDEDLELIFSRFDPNVKVEIIRDHDTGASLQYAFCEFTTKQQCVEAYFKMDGALIDDRRIKVDFSQSVAKIWDRYNQKLKPQRLEQGNLQRAIGPPHSASRRGGRGGRGNMNGSRDHGGRGGGRYHDHQGERGRDRHGPYGSPPPRRDDHHYDRRRDEHRGGYQNDGRDHYHESSRGEHDGGYRDERHHGRDDDYSLRERDDFGRRRRSRSPSPDAGGSWSHKRRKHSRKHHRHERSRYDSDDSRSRHRDDDRYASPKRHDSEDDKRRGGSDREDGEESHGRRGDREDNGGSRHRDSRSDERRHRKKRHRDEDRRHKKRKHKEKRRKSRSRSPS